MLYNIFHFPHKEIPEIHITTRNNNNKGLLKVKIRIIKNKDILLTKPAKRIIFAFPIYIQRQLF